mmetsp:Transcript_25907/g.56782  ORF Transcript_25907/g.56782 Transcript_25907/m.56782 type:complete len:219 (-) Transcript_25907:215-871(-)|eukprot:CAMPEP_0168177432 /NCGR_PEP_ID=MMETSP0139_2-20121125/8451_1 /TAXON_ID=44445 /ORGANISM="Pseudo-nitzschia australis, Strain 10249 10 AB" /LENGTH=218 /DNA_ID=CAMNT_0008096483 /DNA_START=367 /DNA_END=1023 /DNA_ORIENTATION=+
MKSNEETLHVHFDFDHHSYPPAGRGRTNKAPFFGSKRKGTASIPIDRQSIKKAASERHQIAQDQAEADYKDYVFFARVVDGISRQNSLLRDGSYLKSNNEVLIDNIVRSRLEQNDDSTNASTSTCLYTNSCTSTHYYCPQQTGAFQDLKIVTPTRAIDRQALIDSALHEWSGCEKYNDDGDIGNDYNHDGDNHVGGNGIHPVHSSDYEEDEGVFDFEL